MKRFNLFFIQVLRVCFGNYSNIHYPTMVIVQLLTCSSNLSNIHFLAMAHLVQVLHACFSS